MISKCFALIAFLIATFFLSQAPSQAQNSPPAYFLNLPTILKMNQKQQIAFFNKALGKPVLVTSFSTTTEYQNGNEKSGVSCKQYKYVCQYGTIFCFYLGDTRKLGHFVYQPSDPYELDKYKVLFNQLNIIPPAALGVEKGIEGMWWFDFFNYQGFTKIQLGRNRYAIDGLDVYIDRIG